MLQGIQRKSEIVIVPISTFPISILANRATIYVHENHRRIL